MLWPPLRKSLSTLVILLAGCGGQIAEIEVVDARVREPVPGTDKTVGYFTLKNNSPASLVLIGAESPSARAIELHSTKADAEGVTRMRRLADVEVQPGKSVDFAPGGHHLMIFGLGEVQDGMDISILLKDRDPLPVRFKSIGLLE